MKRLILLCSLLLVVPLATADAPVEWEPKKEVLTSSFLYYHPDLKFRMRGLALARDGELAEAFEAFRIASRYADKASQAMVAELYWEGIGVEADRALAYAWMDLAAERGYHNFTVMRERYWKRLDEAERERALALGESIYSEYGDAAARPRLAAKLRRGLAEVTGSRTGFAGTLSIRINGPDGWHEVDGSTYYADRYWKAEDYFAWQDDVWMKPMLGTVDIGPLQSMPVPDTAPAVEPGEGRNPG
jgi:hypothetical protein